MSMTLNELGAARAAALIARRELTSEQLVQACLARIERRDADVGAWSALDAEAALTRARLLDRSPVQGPLHGVPIGIKDAFDTIDFRTAYGTDRYRDYRPTSDAAVVSMSRAAGGVILGKTASTPVATRTMVPTRNPLNQAYTPGGSSSGSAAAVADAMVPLALASQTSGSIIRSASYCGVVGYKPSFGVIPRAGLKILSESFDTVGTLGRSVADVALFASVLMGNPALLQRVCANAPRIGMYRSLHWRNASGDVRDAYADAQRILRAAGAQVDEIEPPTDARSLMQVHADIVAFEASRTLFYDYHEQRDTLTERQVSLVESGAKIPFDEYLHNLNLARRMRQTVDSWFEDHDIVLTLSVAGEAPVCELGVGDPLYCRTWTLCGTPSMHLPFRHGAQGMPIGLQAVGPRLQDHKLVSIAEWVHGCLLAQ